MKIFYARPSSGWLWLIGIALFMLIVLIFPLFAGGSESPVWVVVMNLSMIIFLVLPFLFLATEIKKIRYEIHEDHLYIHMGRFLKYRILFGEIKKVSKKNLQITLWSSFRFPGLALFKVPYADVGTVKMCATAAAKDILIIETEKEKFGITPLDESAFMNVLMKKITP
ncbi:MAG: hypothetical protein CVU39_16795 [Chloroflexi bacterium HGW-Chloroflexi-10]|nr:MAG: hypothetical protein CVU39_16795 [Chloroflexi bacterium HGW-Chloroflexi-10]